VTDELGGVVESGCENNIKIKIKIKSKVKSKVKGDGQECPSHTCPSHKWESHIDWGRLRSGGGDLCSGIRLGCLSSRGLWGRRLGGTRLRGSVRSGRGRGGGCGDRSGCLCGVRRLRWG
jgi:hypothetical protein